MDNAGKLSVPVKMFNYRLTATGYKVFMKLCDMYGFENEFITVYKDIARETGVTTERVKKVMPRLMREGIIKKINEELWQHTRYKLNKIDGDYFTIDRKMLYEMENPYYLQFYCAICSFAKDNVTPYITLKDLSERSGLHAVTLEKYCKMFNNVWVRIKIIETAEEEKGEYKFKFELI